MALQHLDNGVAAIRRSLAQYRVILAERNVALLLGAGIASEIGDWFNTVALIAIAFHFSESALGVGGMFAVRMVTRLLVQGPAGAVVDRYAGRTLLFASQTLMAIVASAFVLLVVVPELWLLYLLVFLLEAVNAIARPAFMVELKAEAPAEHRAAANGALYASGTTAQLVGPLLGAVALAQFGPTAVFALNGLTFAGVALAVARLRGGLRATRGLVENTDDPAPDPGADEAAVPSGYRWLLRRQDLSLYGLVCLSLALLVQATITLFVVRANTLRLGDGGVGVFYAAVAIGSVAGSIIAGARTQHAAPLYPAAVAMGLCAIALAVFGAVNATALAIAALIVAGFATDFYEVVGLTYFQGAVPDALYARFFSVFLLALSAGGLVGALAGPTLAQRLGVEAALTILATPGLALSLVLAYRSKGWSSLR